MYVVGKSDLNDFILFYFAHLITFVSPSLDWRRTLWTQQQISKNVYIFVPG